MVPEEERRFLDDTNSSTDQDDLPASLTKIRYDKLMWLSLATNVFLLLVTCALLLPLGLRSVGLLEKDDHKDAVENSLPEPYSPANAIIQYELRDGPRPDSQFMGVPGQEWEDGIHSLLQGTFIRISEEELQLAKADSIPLKDGGYGAGLGVAHNIHCIKKIKEFIYRDHLFPNSSSDTAEWEYKKSHVDHCLDFLRQSVLCQVDYSLHTLYWGDRQQDIPIHKAPPQQKCVNWQKLHEWMHNRSARVSMLVRPEHSKQT